MNNFFDKFLAKSDTTTLQQHTNHVITAGRNLLERLSFDVEERKYWNEKLYRCAVLHDLGKVHSEFQRRLQGAKDVSIRHEIISLWFCENFLELPEDELFAIATHHKGVIRADAYKRLEMDSLKAHMQAHFESDKELLSRDIVSQWINIMNLNIEVLEKEIKTRISEEKVKILHQKYQGKVIPDAKRRKALSLMRALLIAADHIGSARLEDEIPTFKQIEVKDFQPKKDDEFFEFRDFQVRLQNVKTDIILHAPTGSGKTEAALSWVFANQQKNTRLFYLLPYTASINAMVTRLQDIFGANRVTALHSKTLDFFYEQLADEESNDETKDYAKKEQQARSKKYLSAELFYPVKVATLHQVLKTSLKGKGWELSLYDYKNALFIVDEFHTYNALLTGMMLASIKLFRKVFNARFFFMSATIPKFMLENIIATIFEGDASKLIRLNPNIESDKVILDQKRHLLCCHKKLAIRDKIPLIRDYLDKGSSVLIIVNNVKTAQQLSVDISFENKYKASLLHSGFHKKDRSDIEKKITHKDHKKRPQLLIATQAVEVSLDIDYDVAFIENAPIDALIQRFGRVNRAGEKETAPVFLFENIIGNTKFFYDEEVLQATWKYLLDLDKKDLSESDLVEVCNQVYKKGYNENQQRDFEQGLNNNTICNFETDWIAGDWNNWIEDVLENNNQKVEVLCDNLVEEFDNLKRQKRYIEANQLLVQVYFYELKNTIWKKCNHRSVIVAYDFEYDNAIGYKKKVDDDIFL